MGRKLIFTTWNAQGGVIQDQEKRQVISDLVEDYRDYSAPHIFAIQEAGSNPHLYSGLRGTQYTQIWCAPKGAANERCTVGILAPQARTSKLFPISVGNTRQIPILCWNEAIRLGSMHAVASPLAPNEVQTAIEKLLLNNMPFILGGDMNSEPPQAQGFEVHSSEHPTHSGGRELDYFIACTAVKCNSISVKRVGPSDHDPVTAIFDY